MGGVALREPGRQASQGSPRPAHHRRAQSERPGYLGDVRPGARACTESELVDGLGSSFSPDDPYVGVDLDDCRDLETGELHRRRPTSSRGLDSYTEVSPSGTGVHIFVRGALTGSRNRTGKTRGAASSRYTTVVATSA